MMTRHRTISVSVAILTLGLVLAFASQARAQATVLQGKLVSMVGDGSNHGTAPLIVPAFPATAVAASLPAPAKYKSKNLFLWVTTTLQMNCAGDSNTTTVRLTPAVGAPVFLEPDTGAASFFDCSSNAFFETRTRTWFQRREADGGPFLDNKTPPGAVIDVLVSSGGGTTTIDLRSALADAKK